MGRIRPRRRSTCRTFTRKLHHRHPYPSPRVPRYRRRPHYSMMTSPWSDFTRKKNKFFWNSIKLSEVRKTSSVPLTQSPPGGKGRGRSISSSKGRNRYASLRLLTHTRTHVCLDTYTSIYRHVECCISTSVHEKERETKPCC